MFLEYAPIFSAEMSRFKEQDKFVYNELKYGVHQIGNITDRGLVNYFKNMEVSVSDKRIKRIPNWFVSWLSRKIKKFQAKYPDRPVEVGLLDGLRLLIESLSMFDPDFARVFVDGRFYKGINYAEAFEKTKCHILLIQASWKRYKNHGLVGVFDNGV